MGGAWLGACLDSPGRWGGGGGGWWIPSFGGREREELASVSGVSVCFWWLQVLLVLRGKTLKCCC